MKFSRDLVVTAIKTDSYLYKETYIHSIQSFIYLVFVVHTKQLCTSLYGTLQWGY